MINNFLPFDNYKKEAIYLLYKSDELVYIGDTTQLRKRIYQHKYNGIIDFDHVLYIPLESRIARKQLESSLIIQYRPKHNITYNIDHINKWPLPNTWKGIVKK